MKKLFNICKTDGSSITLKIIFHFNLLGLILMTLSTAAIAQSAFNGYLKSVSIKDSLGANEAPVANFSFSPHGNTLTFDASDSNDPDGSISSYKWDFGDATYSEGSTTQHNYSSYGTYSVTLTVADESGGIAIVNKSIGVNLPAELIGNGTQGSVEMKDNPNFAYFHKLQGKSSIIGALKAYHVTISMPATTGRQINIALYTHNSISNRPKSYISGSETGWLTYNQNSGETLTATPTSSITINSDTQYWIGIRGKHYGGISGETSGDIYYGYYHSETASWTNADVLPTETISTGIAGKLQIEVSQ